MVSAILTILGGVASWAVGLFRSKNTAAMVANAEAKDAQAIKDKVAADVASGDLSKIRDDVAQ
jgi:hypothetical protein